MPESRLSTRLVCRLGGLFLLALATQLSAQDLEPRRWSHLPTGMQVVGVALGGTDGDIFFDPVLRIEDAKFELYTFGSSYVRTFEWLGRSSRVDFRVPYGMGRWDGLLDGQYVTLRRSGLLDPRIRFSINLLGAPPLRGGAFGEYRRQNPVTTTVGAAVSLTLPWGEYFPDRLINLGGNRLVVRPQIGVLHTRGKWQFEVTATAALFQDNNDFFGGTRLEQDPLLFVEGHVIRALTPRTWASLSGGYSYGGESTIDDVPKNNDERTRYTSVSLGIALNRQFSLKLSYVNADTNVLLGSSSNSLVLGGSFAWGGD